MGDRVSAMPSGSMPRILVADHLHLETQHLLEQRGLSETLFLQPTWGALLRPAFYEAEPRQRSKDACHQDEARQRRIDITILCTAPHFSCRFLLWPSLNRSVDLQFAHGFLECRSFL